MKHLGIQILWIFLTLFALPAHAQNMSCGDFAKLPILHEGRLKPMGSFARTTLKDFSDARANNACAWLAESLFDPASAAEHPIFAIRNPDLLRLLNLPGGKSLFSQADLAEGLAATAAMLPGLLKTSPEALTQTQHDLLDLHNRVALHHEIMRSLTLILPLDIEIPAGIKERITARNFLGLQMSEQQARQQLDALIARKGGDYESYSPQEQNLAAYVFALDSLRLGGLNSRILRIIPAPFADDHTWLSPWDAIEQGQGSPENAKYLELWEKMAQAFRAQDPGAWTVSQDQALAHIQGRSMDRSKIRAFALENTYNAVQPWSWSLALYGAAFLAGLIALFKPANRILRALLLTLGCAAVIFHAGALGARILILERPPVGTLYESVLFVAFICASIGVWLYATTRQTTALVAGAGLSAGLLAIAPQLLPDAGSLELLSAVLNTHFWLVTHVLCITIGYALCLACGTLAHIALAGKIRACDADTQALERMIYRLSMFALLFCTAGTILGGIWADQSWGRFWGWDPKENGALLIVLWLLWAQHGKLSHHLDRNGFLIVMAGINVIVALAWFGVNLLGVGLHSYGFISGIAGGLALFCMLEIALIAGLGYLAYQSPRTQTKGRHA